MVEADFPPISDHPQCPQHDSALNGRGFFIQGGGVDLETIGDFSCDRVEPPIRQLVQPLTVIAGQPGRTRDGRYWYRLQPRGSVQAEPDGGCGCEDS